MQEIKILKNYQDLDPKALLYLDEKIINSPHPHQKFNNQDTNAFFVLIYQICEHFLLEKTHIQLQNLSSKEKIQITQIQSQFPLLKDKISNNSLIEIAKITQNIQTAISNLLGLRLQIAIIQNDAINTIYTKTCIILFSFMFVVLLATTILSSSALSSIKLHHKELQRIVREKTLESETINKNLQKTIQEEVESSRKKDQIMYQQDRLASMGEMIQNIAHQWRQPLNSLIILIQSFKTKFYNNKLDAEFIERQTEDGLKIAKNMSDTIENFRNFFQPNKSKDTFSITESILDSIKLIKFVLEQNNIQIHTEIKEDYKLYGYKNSFTQVILNILKNSQDAIIERKISQGHCLITLEKKYDTIIITLRDNAGGVKQKSLYKVFEPYFTTKHKSVGTGIGLYMTKEIVEKQMQGRIGIQNVHWNLDQSEFYGAMFIIEIPHLQDPTSGEK